MLTNVVMFITFLLFERKHLKPIFIQINFLTGLHREKNAMQHALEDS